ncbi:MULTISPECIES: phage tail protein [Paenibacillus]|uniref:phage tail protein n=1 Tax=Paenibacillus TaxID=44249 RepID=UPI0022B93027|nr:phage tail protein [Paenibacillus caseinilyticus]MCZ8520120.1 phage tail protein [Paenibacillus caseinilyticus]
MIGAFGDVVFFATLETQRTFTDFSRKSSARWAKHDVLLRKPLGQFTGPELDQVSFKMRFDVRYGVNPRAEMERLLVMQRDGRVADLTIGGKSLGMGQWVITSLDQSWDEIDNEGIVLVGTASISLEEYIEEGG